jgi:hypothetical protein
MSGENLAREPWPPIQGHLVKTPFNGLYNISERITHTLPLGHRVNQADLRNWHKAAVIAAAECIAGRFICSHNAGIARRVWILRAGLG